MEARRLGSSSYKYERQTAISQWLTALRRRLGISIRACVRAVERDIGIKGDIAMKTLLGYELSPLWQLIERLEDGAAYDHSFLKLRVIESWHDARDGRTWLHVSLSRED